MTRAMRHSRRSNQDRRQAYSLDYFLEGGVERRCYKERRRRTLDRLRDYRASYDKTRRFNATAIHINV